MLEEAKVWVKMKLRFPQQHKVLVVQGTFSLLHTLQFTEQTRTRNPNRSAQASADTLSQFWHASRALAAIKNRFFCSTRPRYITSKTREARYQNSFIITHTLMKSEKLSSIGWLEIWNEPLVMSRAPLQTL